MNTTVKMLHECDRLLGVTGTCVHKAMPNKMNKRLAKNFQCDIDVGAFLESYAMNRRRFTMSVREKA